MSFFTLQNARNFVPSKNIIHRSIIFPYEQVFPPPVHMLLFGAFMPLFRAAAVGPISPTVFLATTLH